MLRSWKQRLRVRAIASAILAAACMGACSHPVRRDLRAITLPDVSRVDPPVQQQIRERSDAVRRANQVSTSDTDLAVGYGQYAMVLHAAESFDAAEPAYLNAQ